MREAARSSARLDPLELQVLQALRSKPHTEKRLGKILSLDGLVLSPVVTGLILQGYVETVRRRRLYFFSRELVTITAEGIRALEDARSIFQVLSDMVRQRASEAIDALAAESPALRMITFSAKALFRFARAMA